MLTNEERAEAIKKRVAELRQRAANRKRFLLGFTCTAACIAVICFLGASLPDIVKGFPDSPVVYSEGLASLIAGGGALGYIMMGIVSFSLGVILTVILTRLRRKTKDERDGHDKF